MLLTTQDNFFEYEIVETLGIVKGNTVRARHAGKDILAAFRNIVGGEIEEYTKLLAESREQSIDRMISSAKNYGSRWNCMYSFYYFIYYAISRRKCLYYGTVS